MFAVPTNRVVFSVSPLARFNSTRLLRVTPRRATGADFGVFECTKAIAAVKCRESGSASTARFSSAPVAMEAFSCTKLPVKTKRMPNQSARSRQSKMRCARHFPLTRFDRIFHFQGETQIERHPGEKLDQVVGRDSRGESCQAIFVPNRRGKGPAC